MESCALPANISLGSKCLIMANALAYYNVELITAVKVLLCRPIGYLIQVGSNYS